MCVWSAQELKDGLAIEHAEIRIDQQVHNVQVHDACACAESVVVSVQSIVGIRPTSTGCNE